MSTELSRLPHPAACPYCGGTIVNQAQPDYLLRPARLNDDGTITVGDQTDASDFEGPSLLFCYGCNSTYVQPADVAEIFDDELAHPPYPKTPRPGDPGYRGMGVAWTATPAQPISVAVAGQG